jgi:hypothetical protein
MAKRSIGATKLTAEVRQRLAEVAAEARQLVYGEPGCPEWGTSFLEMESDAREVGHEFIRLLLEQTADRQAGTMPETALTTGTGEAAQRVGTDLREIETESGVVQWEEPKAYLPKSRKDFFPSGESAGTGR